MTERTDGNATGGLSIRDWFAGQVLPAVFTQMNEPEHDYSDVAGSAYAMADAMIAERDRK